MLVETNAEGQNVIHSNNFHICSFDPILHNLTLYSNWSISKLFAQIQSITK